MPFQMVPAVPVVVDLHILIYANELLAVFEEYEHKRRDKLFNFMEYLLRKWIKVNDKARMFGLYASDAG